MNESDTERLQRLFAELKALEFKAKIHAMFIGTLKDGCATPRTFILNHRINSALSILEEWIAEKRKHLPKRLY